MSKAHSYTIRDLSKLFTSANRQIEEYRKQPSDTLLFKLSEDSWSIREICQHLIEFGKLYLEQMDRAISKTRPLPQKKGPFRPRWIYRKAAGFMEPPYKLKVKTLPMMEPAEGQDAGKTLDDLADIQANVLYLLENAKEETWNLEKIKGRNPISRFIPMNLIEFLVLMDAHQRRHFWQIEQILKKTGSL